MICLSSFKNIVRLPRFYGFGFAAIAPVLCAVPVAAQLKTPQANTRHTFVFQADKPLRSVAVAGTFNNWNKGANPMKVDADGRTWRLTLPLELGLLQYKFVLDDATWIPDPKAARNETDASGNVNSLLFLAPPDYARPASPNDGQTAASALFHAAQLPFLNFDQGKLGFSLRVRPGDVREVRLRLAGQTIPMKLRGQNEIYATYQGQLPWNGKTNLSYNFQLLDGNRVRNFGANGLDSSAPFRLSAKQFKPFVVPDWVEQTVFYQIFPDRFENGDSSNDPPDVQAWNAAPTYSNRFGGDVAGVEKHIGYLKNLGISGVYFNPIFKSPSNHRYDAQDYKQIDPGFGTNAEFSALTKDLQKAGIRTVMDFVFNHTATTFAPFADVREKGAASTFKNWYFVKSFPVQVADPPNYVAWNNFPSMPKLNLMNPQTSDYMLNLVNFWKREVPLAGLRLDVADEVDVRFWRKLRTRVKGLDPQMWIVGERWSDASPWLQGDQWDAAMNYPFLFANVEFFADGKTSASAFTNRLTQIYGSYPPQVSRAMMNLLSSHDRPRFLTVANNDARLHQLAATVQFTWAGAPSIYYGEELGMQGGADPDNRRGMEWNRATPDNAMLGFYKKLIHIRNTNRVLQSGDPAILLVNDGARSFAWSRTWKDETAVIAINRSDALQTLDIPLPAKMRGVRLSDALNGKSFRVGQNNRLKVQLAPLSSAILLRAKSSLLER